MNRSAFNRTLSILNTLKQTYYIIPSLTALLLSTSISANEDFVTNAKLPTNAKATCTADIKDWFASRQIIPNGWVAPANSLDPIFADFKHNTRCDFYKWGAQMFLWLTSGIDTKHVFNTAPVFYNVSVATNSERHFIAEDGPMRLGVRKGKIDDEIEMGQAGGGDVLISQKKSLVYYGIHANDVYAIYTTGQKNKAFKKPLTYEFPNTPQELEAVSNYAAQQGYPLGWEKIALAMELKTSWVDASTLTKKNDYVLTQAVVPVFDRSKPKGPWTITSTEEKTLALVGMHVVGTVNQHPEMVWSTFEHINNVPDNAYIYNTSSGTATQPYQSKGNQWTFLPEGAAMPTAIDANAKVQTSGSSEEIVNINGADIGPINNLRVFPWGNLPGSSGDTTSIANNTDLVSINVSVLSQLAKGDIRGNYIQTGGIWTAKGQIPSNGSDTNLRGSLHLANTTMETFYQYDNPNGFKPINCFGCHSSTPKKANQVSHIFGELQPLSK
ncbi:MAG: hypothetical protein ACRBCI_13210 [Cellvibrionaceae bacterium]